MTAFVLRIYAQAKRYIYIDDKDVEDSRKWLLSLQDFNGGCFKEMGMIHHKEMKVGKLFRSTKQVVSCRISILKIRESLSSEIVSLKVPKSPSLLHYFTTSLPEFFYA